MSTETDQQTEEGALAKTPKRPSMLGNTNAITVGDLSPVIVGRLAKELKAKHGEKFLEDFHWLADSDYWAADLFWEKLAQYRLCRRFCARKGGDHDRAGKVHAVAVRGDKHWSQLLTLLDKLGGTPSSRSSMGLNVAKGQFYKEKLAESLANDNNH